MSEINLEKVVEGINLERIKRMIGEEKNLDKIDLEKIVKDIDLSKIIKNSLMEKNPNIKNVDLEEFVKDVDLVEIVRNIAINEGANNATLETTKLEENMMEKVLGEVFEDMTEEEMLAVQGAGDMNEEWTPTVVTTSSAACIGGIGSVISAASGAVWSAIRC